MIYLRYAGNRPARLLVPPDPEGFMPATLHSRSRRPVITDIVVGEETMRAV